MFALDRANKTGDEMAERIGRHLNRVIARSRHEGPFLYVIHHDLLAGES
jgi:hypothetical protein